MLRPPFVMAAKAALHASFSIFSRWASLIGAASARNFTQPVVAPCVDGRLRGHDVLKQ
jgi:hypothetical protein